MDDPKTSQVTGQVEFAVPPALTQGMPAGPEIAIDGYAISKFSRKSKDLLFRTIACATNQQNMRAGAAKVLPTRRSILEDLAMQKQFRTWTPAAGALKVSAPIPQLAEFSELVDPIAVKIQQALNGDLDPQRALDQAAEETRKLLQARGYYR